MSDIRLTWLGHSAFVLEYEGKIILIDPWVMQNPSCPEQYKQFDKIDLMLITHGHFDHIGDAVVLAGRHEPTIVAIFETGEWLSKKGVGNLESMNKGGTLQWEGIDITMTTADHSCGITDDDGSIIYGGEAVGYVLSFPNGKKIYHAGDTNVFGDMALIHDLYNPDLAILPVGDRFTMGPREAARAIDLLEAPKVIPMHFGTFPMLTGTPDQLRLLTREKPVELIELTPGETYVH